MSGLYFPDLSITGFRGFKHLPIPQLGRVTLITGKNNTGKSSVLEALRLHAQNASPATLHDILSFREENIRGRDEEERPYDPERVSHVSALFHGFPLLSEGFDPIAISTNGKSHPMKLTIAVDWFTEERDPEGRRRLIDKQGVLFPESELVPVLVVTTEEGKQLRSLDSIRRHPYWGRVPRPRSPNGYRMPCIPVNSYSGEGTYSLGHLWDEIALTDSERYVVDALRIIEPRISAVSMVGGEDTASRRTAIVGASHIVRPVPLRSFGDGLNHLFAIVLSLVNARGGILLVDEFENGLHHTVQLDAWRMIFQLAESLDVQVFATSHGGDAIETFQKAAAEAPEDGALLRLVNRGGDIIPTVFVEDELAIVTRDKIEVR